MIPDKIYFVEVKNPKHRPYYHERNTGPFGTYAEAMACYDAAVEIGEDATVYVAVPNWATVWESVR